MKNKNIWAAVAGLAAIGAGVGAALVYLKKKQGAETDVEELEEELFDEEECECDATERTYTVLSDATPAEEATEEVTEE